MEKAYYASIKAQITMLKKVKLYGELGDKFGKEWNLDINSPSEAIRALDVNNVDFRSYMVNSESKGIAYKIVVGKSYLEEKEELYNPSGRQEIKIIPVVLGAKKSGLGMILLGAVLIMAPMFAPQMFGSYGAGTAMTAAQAQSALITGTQIGGSVYTGFAATLAQASMKIGIALVLNGVASLLAPTPPKPKERPEDIGSYGFDGPANTTRQGVPIPVCYGQLIVGGAVISSGIEPEDYEP